MFASSTNELKMLDKAAAEFARKQLSANNQENDKYPFGPFFDSVLHKAYEVDFFHTILPEALGGMQQGMHALCTILDNVCRADSSLGGIIFTNTFAQKIILSANGEKLLQSIVSSAADVKRLLIAYPVFNNPTEVETKVQAIKTAGKYILSGDLEYLVLGGIAAHAVIPAKIQGQSDFSFFIIDLSDDRVLKSDPVLSLGFHACPAVDVTFNHAEGKLLGDTAKGNTYFNRASDVMHVAAASISAGIMKGAYKEALDYSQNRFQGGREIFNWSEIQMILANMAIKVKIAEMVIAQACQAVDYMFSGWRLYSHAAAIHVSEMACEVTTDGIQVLGGVGYMEDYGQAKRYRDAKQAQCLLGIAPMKKIRYLGNLISN
jgi:alkylation response protein AidB-like acyl-CoA dehydrogenase